MSEYKDLISKKTYNSANEIIETLPEYCQNYFDNKSGRHSANTALSYAIEIRKFLIWMTENITSLKNHTIREIPIESINNLTDADAGHYMRSIRSLKSSSKKHCLAALNGFFKFLIRTKRIQGPNPFDEADVAAEEHKVVYLDKDEKASFLNSVVDGEGLSNKQKKYYEKNSVRDTAIALLFFATGLRVSELVGIDIDDINFNNHSIRVTQKGKQETDDYVYMSDESEGAVREYLEIRESLYKPDKNEKALFLNHGRNIKDSDGKIFRQSGYRITIKSTERLVKRYKDAANITKKVTPHRLRATFAMNVLESNGDLRLTQQLMHHKNVQTTQIYTTRENELKSYRNITESNE